MTAQPVRPREAGRLQVRRPDAPALIHEIVSSVPHDAVIFRIDPA